MAPNAHLVTAKGPQPGQIFSLDQSPLILGRDPRNAITVDHPEVSRRHARIAKQGDTWVAEDLGSTNGTFVNGRRLVGPQPLVTGDVIGLSEAVLLTFQEGKPTSDAFPRESVTPPPAPRTPSPGGEDPDRRATSFEPRARKTELPSPGWSPRSGPETKPTQDRTWLWIGAGCAVLLVVAACTLVLILAYLDVLSIF